MREGQFSLDGYVFGLPSDRVTILTEGLEVGGWESRTQDELDPMGDRRWFGRDFKTPATWTFTMLVHDDNGYGPHVQQLASAWSADRVRSTPQRVSRLDYCRGGEVRSVTGRPRSFAYVGFDADLQAQVVTGAFDLATPVTYGAERSTVLRLPVQSVSGFTVPLRVPFTLGASLGGRTALVDAGPAPVPFTATILGPVTGVATSVSLVGAGWQVHLLASLTAGQRVVWESGTGVITLDGAPATRHVTPGSDLVADLPGGVSEVQFSAADASLSTVCHLTWRDGKHLI